MKQLDMIGWVCLIIVLVGGINWGLVGLLNINLVQLIFGGGLLGRLIYIIVGGATGYLCYLIYMEKKKTM